MKHRHRIAPFMLAIALALTALPAIDGHAQGVPADPGLPGPYATEQFNFTLQGLGAQAGPSGGAAQLNWQPFPMTPLASYSIYRLLLLEPGCLPCCTLEGACPLERTNPD